MALGAVCLASLSLLGACGDGPSGPPPVTGVRLINTGPASSILLPPGIPLTIQVEVYDSNFNLLPTPPRTAFIWRARTPQLLPSRRMASFGSSPEQRPPTRRRSSRSTGPDGHSGCPTMRKH